MKTRSKILLTVFLIFALALISAFALTPLTASARDREITAVDSGNSFNMRLNSEGVLTWNEVPGATGYKVVLLNSMGQSIWEWDNDLTNNSRVLPFIVEMDNRKYDSGRYVIEVVAKDTSNKNSISYYYTSNVDKLEEPIDLIWLGNQANWEYVDGASKYTVSLFNFEGLVASEVVTECPVDFSEHNPQDGWTFTVQAETNGALNDKRNSNVAESPKRGSDARTINTVDSGNALNMKIVDGVLKWDEVLGATGYQVILKNPVGLEIYRWDNDLTNNARVLSIISEMDNLKVNRGHYRIEVEPKDAGTVAVIANYYYTSNVEKFEAPHNLKWNDATATWATVEGAFSYKVTLYDFNGQVTTVTVTDDWYDFSEYNPQDGWTFKVQAEGDGTFTAKRASNATESPAKTTSYNLSVVAYGIGNLEGTGKVSLETENVTQDFASSVGGSFIKNTEITIKAEANPGYEFVGWRHTAPENSEATLSTNETYTFDLTTNLNLFAVFRTIPTEYSVSYHGNGASGSMPDETVIAGEAYTLVDCGYDTPYGKKFIGWAIGSADATPIMQPDDEITINADTIIYAVWENIYFTTQPTDTSGKIGTDVKLPVTINLLQVPDEETPYIHLEVMNGVTWEKVAEAKRSEWTLYDNGFSIQQNTACTKSYQYKIYNGSEWIESDTFTVEFLPLIVSFEDSTHSTTTAPVEIDTVGGTVSKPADPVASGDTFSCWWNNGPWDFESNTITKDVTLFASWLGVGFYSEIPDVYAKLGAQARIDLAGVNYNSNYTYLYKYDGANWVQGEAVTNYSYFNLPASAVETVETYKIVINAATPVESNVFTVTWTDTTYTLSFNANGGSGTMANVNTIGSYTLPLCDFNAPEGYRFAGWATTADGEVIDSATYMVLGNTQLFAIWEETPTFIVAYDPGEGNGSTDFDYVIEGTTITLLNPADLDFTAHEGMTFSHWKVCKDNASDPNFVEKQPDEQITITFETYIIAVWKELPTFIVAYGPGEGNGSTDFDYVIEGTTITLLNPADLDFTAQEGMTFSHWKVCKDNASDPNFVEKQPGEQITITFETYIIAVWKEDMTYDVSFSANGGTGEMATVNDVSSYVLPENGFTAPSLKYFKAWAIGSIEGAQKQPGETITVDADTTIYAIWADYTIINSVHLSGGATPVPGANPDLSFTVETEGITGFATLQWCSASPVYLLQPTYTYVAGKEYYLNVKFEVAKGYKLAPHPSNPNSYSITMTYDLSFTSMTITGTGYIKLYYTVPSLSTVSFSANGGVGAMASIPVVENENYTLPESTFTAPVGHQFKGWSVNGVEKAVGDQITVSADVEIKAVWKANAYTITFDTKDGSAVDPITQDYGTSIVAPADPTRVGYTFAGWDKEIPATMPAENMTINATWEINQYTITFDTNGGNAIDPITLNFGVSVVAPAGPSRVGYTFAGWDKEIPATMPAENMTITATWEVNQYTIVFDTKGGSVIAPITQDYGTTVVAPANPTKDGFVFTGWDVAIPATMPAENMTINATWVEEIPDTYTVTYTDGVDGEVVFADQIIANLASGTATPSFEGTPSRDGYTFVTWTPEVADTVTESVTYTATWTLIPVHSHTDADGKWESDGTNHWHTCSCGEEFDKTACSGGEATCTERAICSTCGNAYGSVKDHDFGTEWKNDENNHWKECACGEKSEQGAHADVDENGACDTCGRELSQETPEIKPDDPEKDGLSGGAIAGIAVAGVAVAGMGGFAIFWFVIKKKTIADLIAIFKKK